MKNENLLLLLIGLMLVSLPLTACRPAVPTAAPTVVPTIVQPTELPSEPAVNFPTGKFIKVGEPNRALVFNKNGTFIVLEGNSTLVSGTYSVDGGTYTDESNTQACPPMSFKYTFDGTNLTFNYVGNPANDPCMGRMSDFNHVSYTLSK